MHYTHALQTIQPFSLEVRFVEVILSRVGRVDEHLQSKLSQKHANGTLLSLPITTPNMLQDQSEQYKRR